jgi:uncharacterized membrane protein
MADRPQNEHDPEVLEENVYAGVYHALLIGMYISTTLFAIAIARALLHPEFVPLTGEWVRDHYHWAVLRHGLATLDPTALMLVATAVLILTPVARVLVSIYAFAVDRNTKYVVITGIVFVIMVLTVILGLSGLK